MSLKTAVSITVGKHEYIEQLASVLARAFANDPLTRCGILYEDSAPNDTVVSPDRWTKFWIPNITNKINTGGQIIEAGNWAAAALWFPPGIERPPLGSLDELPAPIVQYLAEFKRIKQQCMKGRKFWYLNMIGRHPERKDPGVVRALIDPFLKRAQEEGLPVFLEATSIHARDVYAHLGFKVVEELVIGQGHINELGNIVAGGNGVTMYGMIVEPGN